MAGLQYNFFPTDLLYPLPKTNKKINTSQQNSLLIKTKKDSDELLDDSKSYNKSITNTTITNTNNNKNNNALKAISSSSSSTLVSLIKHEENQDYDQDND